MKSNQQKKTNRSNKRYNSSKRKPSNRQGDDIRDTREGSTQEPKYAENSPDWYGSDASILRDFASYPFSFATGTPIKMNDPVLTLIRSGADEMVVPGVTIQWLQPTIGHATKSSDPVNVAMNSLYSAIRSANSGAKNYDAPDQFMYCLAVASIYSYLNWMQRIYGMATTLYSQGNRYLPQKLLEAEYIDYTSIRDNVANFRGAINLMINKAASFAVPNTLSIFKRWAFLYQGLYSEGSTIKDQMYMYSPASFYRFGLDAEGKGQLSTLISPTVTAAANNKLATAQELINYGNNLIDAIFSDEDIQIIGGDILKAFGSNQLITLSSLPEVYPIIPVNSVEVLEQMANATVIHDYLSSAGSPGGNLLYNCNIKQVVSDLPTSPYLTCENHFQFNGISTSAGTMHALSYQGLGRSKFLTTTTNQTGPELVVVNSRLMATISNYSRDGVTCEFNLESGTEIAWAQCYVTLSLDVDDNLDLERYWTSFIKPFKIDADNLQDESVKTLRMLSVRNFFKFNSPIIQYVYRDGSVSPAVQVANGYLNQAVDNATLIHDGDLRNLHQVALMNLLHVPAIAKR